MVPLAAGSAFACSGGGTPCFTASGVAGTCSSGGACVPNANPDGTCTADSEYDIPTIAPGTGIVSTIIKFLKQSLDPISQQIFSGIIGDSGFASAIKALIILYVSVYGLLFTFGMVQLTVSDFAIRVFKMSVVASMVTGSAWGLFTQTFIKFFNDGTDALITQFGSIVVGGNSMGGNPFDWMDQAIVTAVSTKMIVTIMSAVSTGPYGLIIVIILLVSVWSFIKSMLQALWVYIMSLVMRTLLFGLAPIFFACILFQRTRPLFDGWLNQVVNSCLQPVFLFAFFAFFVQLIKSCLDQVVALDVCWTEWSETLRGTPFSEHFWRFAVYDGGMYVPFDGQWDFTGPVGVAGPVNPIGIMLPLTMWIIADLAGRFNDIVVQIAKDISSATTDFTFQGRNLFETAGNTNQAGGASTGQRAGPGGAGAPPASGGGDSGGLSNAAKVAKEIGGMLTGNRATPGDKPTPTTPPSRK